MTVDNCVVDNNARHITITASESFCSQHFTPQLVKQIYEEVAKYLPKDYAKYRLSICNKDGRTLEHHISNIYNQASKVDPLREWKKHYEGTPWVSNISRPYTLKSGLAGTHLLVSPSHGKVFRKEKWRWQRPPLFCTIEDLYTNSLAFSYVIPMLENAGAIVATTRERDRQTQEIILSSTSQSATSLKWQPDFAEAGEYAVYVSYESSKNSATNAHYIVHHLGGATHFRINQQMGGGIWVYLGTFSFPAGSSEKHYVELVSDKDTNGRITGGGVRFGGGMGDIARGDSAHTSGLPRYFEAARYYAQTIGMPPTVYNSYEKKPNDYYDDIRTRPLMANYMAGGSIYLPDSAGLGIPIDLSIALHTDAGWREDGCVFGTLGISTSKGENENYFLPTKLSRYASSDFIDVVMTEVDRDLNHFLGNKWMRRERFDRNYGETRLALMPSVILEMLSHQSFSDLRYGHDPHFKFALARAIYKGVLRYMAYSRNAHEVAVQPLPVQNFAAVLNAKKQSVHLSWDPTTDELEPTAKPTHYILYTKTGSGDFDNGIRLNNKDAEVTVKPGIQYAFKVTALNAGGESFPSEELTAYIAPESKANVLIIYGFTRLSGPALVELPDSTGFNLYEDIGVPYLSTTAFCGAQQVFNPIGTAREGVGGFGYSTNELEALPVVGNTFNYPTIHGKALAVSGLYSFSSCSRQAVETGKVNLNDYCAVDYICGLERNAPHNLVPTKVLTPSIKKKLSAYLKSGGNLLISGSHIGKDLTGNAEDREFANEVLKYRHEGSSSTDSTLYVVGLGTTLPITRTHSATRYWLQSPDILMPAAPEAFPLFLYGEGSSAGVAYQGRDYHLVALGFPFECLADDEASAIAMKALMQFLFE